MVNFEYIITMKGCHYIKLSLGFTTYSCIAFCAPNSHAVMLIVSDSHTRNWIHLIICFSTAAAIAGLFGVGDLLFHPSFCAPCNVYFKEITSVNGHLLLSKFSLSNYLQFTAKYTAVFTFTKIINDFYPASFLASRSSRI